MQPRASALEITAAEKRAANGKIWSMALPVMIDTIFQQMGNIVVAGLIGHVGMLASSAVGLSVRFTSLVWALFRGLTTAVTIYVSQAHGAGNGERMKNVAIQALYLTAFVSTGLALAIALFARALLLIFSPDAGTLAAALGFMRIVCWGLPFLSIVQICNGIMQGAGNARRPMLVTFVLNASIIVIALPFFLTAKREVGEALAIAGIAMVASQVLAAAFALWSVFGRNAEVGRMEPLKGLPHPDGKVFAALLRVGLPASTEYLAWQTAAIFISKIIFGFGTVTMGAYQIGLQVEALSYLPAGGLSVAITSLVGQAIGGEQRDLARYYYRRILLYMFVITTAVSLLFLFGNTLLMRLMTDDAQGVSLGATYLFLMGLVQLPQNLSHAIFGAMRGAGHTKPPMFIAMMGIWAIRVPVSFALTLVPGIGITAIWSVMCIDLTIRFLIALLAFRRIRLFESSALAV